MFFLYAILYAILKTNYIGSKWKNMYILIYVNQRYFWNPVSIRMFTI